MQLTLPVVTFAAFLDSLNPCAISVLLLTLGFLASLNKSRREVVLIGSMYVFGIFLTYIFIGLSVLQALTFFGIPHGLSKFGSLIIILTGLINLLGNIFPKFPIKLVIPQITKPTLAKFIQKATIPAAFILGSLVGLFEFPCTGGPYLLILSLLHDRSTLVSGLGYLIFYNLIFVSPLVLILFLAGNKRLMAKVHQLRTEKSTKIDLYTSIAMILLGLIIFAF